MRPDSNSAAPEQTVNSILSPARSGQGEGAPTLGDAEAAMAEMRKRFHDEGGELYVSAAE